MEPQPLVSIVTPSYNQGQFIEDTLLSVKNQAYPNLEHIVIDGGSQDSTVQTLKRYQGEYNMLWVSEADQGHAHAVNKGFDQAAGKIIGWVNSDDAYFLSSTVEKVVRHFQSHPEIDIIYGDIVFMSKDSTLLLVRCTPRQFSYQRLLRGCFISQPAVFLRRQVITRERLDPDIKYAVDYEYWLRVARSFRFGHFNEILACDRYYAERRMLLGEKEIDQESRQLQKRYGSTDLVQAGRVQAVDRTITGAYRRFLGLFKMMGIYRRKEFAFPLQLEDLSAAVLRQIDPRGGYRKLAGWKSQG